LAGSNVPTASVLSLQKGTTMTKRHFTRRKMLQLSAAGMGAGLAPPLVLGGSHRATAAGRPLVVSDFGGDWGAWNQQNIDARFTQQTTAPVTHDTGSDNAARIAKARLGIPRSEYDLICLADSFFPRAESEGILEKLDYKSPRLSNVKDIDPKFVTPNYTSFLFNGLGLAFNPKMVKTVPTSWKDLLNPEYKGKIVLPAVTHSFGLHVILLCALAAGKDYKDTAAGLENLKVLADLQPIWSVDSQANARSLFQEEAAIGWIGRAEWVQLQGWGGSAKFVVPSEGGFLTSWGFGTIKNSKSIEATEEYINITLDPKLQAANAKKLGFHPTNTRWKEFADPDTIAKISWTPEEQKRFVTIDYTWLTPKRSELTDAWNRIVGR
jgi:putative spermidine/putrescine transport system substrate-binding protein